MMRYIKYLFLVIMISSCKKPVHEKLTPIASWNLDFENESAYNRTKGNAHSGNYFSHADKNSPYTGDVIYKLPDSLKKHFVRVCMDVYAKIGGRRFGQSLVVSLQRKGELLYWETFDINTHTFSKEKWVHIVDSSQFFYDIPNSEEVELKVFGFSSYKKSYLDIDDMHVTLKKVERLSDVN